MNTYLLVFAAVVGVALCAPLTETEEAAVRLVQKTHKLYKAGVVSEDILGTACDLAGTLACLKQGTACTVVQTGCQAVQHPAQTVLDLLGGVFG